MDVSSTSAVNSTSNSATIPSANTTTRNVKTSDGKSFNDEMKNSQSQEVENETTAQDNTSQNTEKSQENKNNKQIDEQNIVTEKNKNDDIKDDFEDDKTNILSINIQQLLATQNQILNQSEKFDIKIEKNVDLRNNIGEMINYNVLNMDENDAIFFVDMVQNNQAGLQNIAVDIKQAIEFGTESVQKSAHVSKTLLTALQNTVKTGQAVRIDFGNDIAVIMRVSKDGSIMANFIPGDKAVEQYLKNNIDFLKQRFDEENIPYSQLSYSQHQQQREHKQNKEDKHE